jgi:ArsR family transcriptional regulator
MVTETLDRLPIDQPVLERAARVIRVLGHPLRLRILESLESGERHVTELAEATGASQAMISQQLGILRSEGVVGARRDGPRVFYHITEPKVSRILDCIRECDLAEVGDGAAELLVAIDLLRGEPTSARPDAAPADGQGIVRSGA